MKIPRKCIGKIQYERIIKWIFLTKLIKVNNYKYINI